jgi:hypothetical protein
MTLVNAFGAIALDSTLQAIRDRLPILGQKNKAGSVSVTLASDQDTLPVSGPLTDTQLRASAVPVSGTFFQATQPISASALPLPTGAATETTLASLNTKTPAVGQTTMSASSPVVIASDQSNVPVTPQAVSTTGNITALNGSVTLTTQGTSGVAIDLRGTFVATVTFQGTIDGTTFFNLQATPVASSNNVAAVTTAAAAGAWYVQSGGCVQVRAIATAFTSGTITATIRGVTSPGWVYSASVGATNAVTISSGTVTTVTTVGSQTPVVPTASFINSAATTNATAVKASAGTVWSIIVSNVNAAARYVKFYNLAVAPTVGTSVPVFTITISAGSTVQIDGGANGIRFGTGIALAITGAMADSDTTAVAASEIKVSTQYT